ncbi:XRE family transcriptional regulator [Tenacibaculum mesophilum]|uniref:XRE family transcriptional regulator n=1 Tax=Tenacibaculum mesophilum TaxID=104268 RepID=UPI00069E8631|nr:helix-turn-helix domain-containing protein [Tenacibaculum mesophilum]
MVISLKLKELRKEKKLSQKEFSSLIKIDSSQYGKIERGVLKPTLEHLIEISSVFGVSIDYLLLGKEQNTSKKTNIESKVPQVITVDSNDNDNVVMVPVKAQAGYLNGYGDQKFISKLPTYRLPNVSNGVFRMFQVKGHSMIPTLHQNSYVVGQFVENWITDIKDNRIYVIISEEDGVVVKRCLNRIEKYGNLFAKSDNRKEYPSYNIEKENIKEVWEVKGAFLYDLPDPADLYDKVYDLEAELLHIKNIITTTKKYTSEPESPLKVAEKNSKYKK